MTTPTYRRGDEVRVRWVKGGKLPRKCDGGIYKITWVSPHGLIEISVPDEKRLEKDGFDQRYYRIRPEIHVVYHFPAPPPLVRALEVRSRITDQGYLFVIYNKLRGKYLAGQLPYPEWVDDIMAATTTPNLKDAEFTAADMNFKGWV